MSTRSDIIVHRADGKWHRIYCHFDGYLEHNGRILFDHYTDQDKAEKLVALGDLSVLAPEIGAKHPFDNPYKWGTPAHAKFTNKYKNWCLAYGRDRGESDVAGVVADTIQGVWPEENCWTEFTYVWHDDGNGPRWWVTSPDEGTQTLVDLGQALTGEVTVRASVKAFGCIIGQHQPTKPGKEHKWSGAL